MGPSRLRAKQAKVLRFRSCCLARNPGLNPDDTRVFRLDESASPARRATILLVEDEEPLRLAIAKMLRKWGLEVFEAASGSAAIDLLRTKGGEIDLMLLDLTIPGASSQEVLAEAAVAQPNVEGGPDQRL